MGLYASANGGALPTDLTYTERTLSNNQDFAEMKKTRYHWMSDSVGGGPEWPQDQEESVALQPQRIRLFRVAFNSAGETNFIQ